MEPSSNAWMNLLICCTIGIDAFPYLNFLTKKSLLLDNLMVSLGSQRRMREIFITRSASSKVASLLAKEENPGLNLYQETKFPLLRSNLLREVFVLKFTQQLQRNQILL